ncbi:MAG TPA: PAS-domain containing protein [Stellaceae bacterium]|nr:PAS-domain containing protein [Stellaceae bacterium]
MSEIDPAFGLVVESIANFPDGLAILDAAGTIVVANETYRLINPLVEPWAGSDGAGDRDEVGIVEIEGEERWYRVVERHTRSGGVLRHIVDISEQKRREADLVTSQMRLREAIESLEEGFALFDASDRLVMVNSRYRAIFSTIPDIIKPGVPFEHLIRVAAERQQNVESLESPEKWVRERMQTHRAAEGIFEHHFSDGRWIMVTERKTADGHTIGTYSDITALKRREEHLRATVDNIAEAILVLDADLKISALNRSALAMFSTESDRATATERLRSFVAEHLSAQLAQHSFAEPMVLEHTTAAGKAIEVRPSAMPDGGFVVTFSDVTARKAAAEREHQSQKLEALGHLAGGVAHEFNNLLTAIGGFAKMAVRRPELSEFVRDCLDEIITASDRAANLTRQMLTFGRKQPLDTRVVDPVEIVRGLDRMLRTLVPETIELAFDIDDSGACVAVDPSQLSQAILNLVLNARDAMPDGGKLTVGLRLSSAPATAATSEKGLQGKPCVALFVSDDGTGIDANVIPHLFEPFFTTKEQGKGTGLGLSVVYSIVERSGGIIDIETELGRGTTFSIYLPITAGETEDDRPFHALSRGNDERVIVVEDEPGVRNLAYAALTQLGYHCFKAVDGADAMKLLDRLREPPDLLLTDIVMPGRNGYQVAAEFAARYPALKVVYMSGYADRAGDSEGPAAPFLPKPFSPEQLVAVIRAVLDGAEIPRLTPPLLAAG